MANEVQAQRYSSKQSLEWMEQGLCPECGHLPLTHSDEYEFWKRPMDVCSLRNDGVTDRIAQYMRDRTAKAKSQAEWETKLIKELEYVLGITVQPAQKSSIISIFLAARSDGD